MTKPEDNEMRVGTVRGEMAKAIIHALENERTFSYYQIDELGEIVLDVYVEVPIKK
jgi:hypothetical protein